MAEAHFWRAPCAGLGNFIGCTFTDKAGGLWTFCTYLEVVGRRPLPDGTRATGEILIFRAVEARERRREWHPQGDLSECMGKIGFTPITVERAMELLGSNRAIE